MKRRTGGRCVGNGPNYGYRRYIHRFDGNTPRYIQASRPKEEGPTSRRRMLTIPTIANIQSYEILPDEETWGNMYFVVKYPERPSSAFGAVCPPSSLVADCRIPVRPLLPCGYARQP